MENNLRKNATIFKIIDNTNNQFYISYTLTTIENKMNQLKYDYNNHVTNNRPFILKDVFQNNNYRTQIIETLENASEIEILSRLRELIKTNDCINRRRNIGLKKEIGAKYAKKICADDYRNRHKDEIKLCKAKIVVCECGIEISNNHLSRHRKTQKHFKNLDA